MPFRNPTTTDRARSEPGSADRAAGDCEDAIQDSDALTFALNHAQARWCGAEAKCFEKLPAALVRGRNSERDCVRAGGREHGFEKLSGDIGIRRDARSGTETQVGLLGEHEAHRFAISSDHEGVAAPAEEDPEQPSPVISEVFDVKGEHLREVALLESLGPRNKSVVLGNSSTNPRLRYRARPGGSPSSRTVRAPASRRWRRPYSIKARPMPRLRKAGGTIRLPIQALAMYRLVVTIPTRPPLCQATKAPWGSCSR